MSAFEGNSTATEEKAVEKVEEKVEEVKAAVVKEEKEEEGDDSNAPEDPEEESNAQFTPVIRLEEVEVKSTEEDEDIIYSQRSKLYIYGETLLDKGTGNKTWRERGVGDCKILKHKESSYIRLLMRQEKTMKVIANHIVDPRIQLSPNAGSDKSWVWVAFDYAEGELAETTFALKFASPELANDFKKQFETSQEQMRAVIAGEDAESGSSTAAGEADTAAEALSSLAIKTEEKKEEEAEK